MVKHRNTERGQAAVEFALVLPFVIMAIASLVFSAVLIRDQLALWHGAYAGAYAASLEPTNQQAIREAVITESGLTSVEITSSQQARYVTVVVSTTRSVELLIFNWSIRLFPLSADVTMHIQDTSTQ